MDSKQKGYTIIELMVLVALVVLIISLVVVVFNSGMMGAIKFLGIIVLLLVILKLLR